MNHKKVIIVGDIRRSSRISDRGEYWDKLNHSINKINKVYQNDLFAEFIILKGDELSSVAKTPLASYLMVDELMEYLLPYQVRFSIHLGDIDIGLASGNASVMDGPGFWKANDSLELLKKKNHYLYFDFGNESLDCTLTSLAGFIYRAKIAWTKKEWDVIRLIRNEMKQTEIAEKLGISQQAVSAAIKRSGYNDINEANNCICKILSAYDSLP